MIAFVCVLIEAWARLYTLGLPPAVRRDRLDLIRSDIADQAADTEATNALTRALPGSLIGRWLRGAPADVTWRVFDARRLAPTAPDFATERKAGMITPRVLARFYFHAAVLAWLTVFVLAIESPSRSLTWAGAALGLIAVIGWTLEALRDPDDAGQSAWPPLLAIGIAATAGGIAFEGGRTGLLLATPLAAGLTIAFLRRLNECRTRQNPSGDGPLPARELADHARSGDVIAIERREGGGVTRRALLRGGFGVGIASVFAAMAGVMTEFLWRRNVSGFGGVVTAGLVTDFAPGTKTIVRAGKFWLVNLTPEQGGPGFLALWQKCPHLGCVVPWNDRFNFVDPRTGNHTEGWFRCPCHQSTYDHAGVRVYGPAPRSMDRMALRITEDGVIEVDTSDIARGTEDNATFAVRK